MQIPVSIEVQERMRAQDTIFALSSGRVPSAVAVVRISGPAVMATLESLCGALPTARQATLRWIRNRNGEPIDQGLVLYFPGPHSFTGEDCAELQVHGGRATVAALLSCLADIPGLRHAEAGEFTRRAFANGKLDLVEIEGLADLIAADTEMQRKLAIEQAAGGLSRLYEDWARRLTRVRAMIEADLDFSDQEDAGDAFTPALIVEIRSLATEISDHIASGRAAEIIRDGFEVVIAGRPNAGKSSLMNALSKRDVAIVSDIAGTTRDVLTVDLDLGGHLVHLRDTAGLRDAADAVEEEGIRRAFRSIDKADLVLLLRDVADQEPFMGLVTDAEVLHIATKIDQAACGSGEIGISTTTGEGIDSLLKQIQDRIESRLAIGGISGPVRQRQQQLLSQAVHALAVAGTGELAAEIVAEHLRQAAYAIGKITGSVDVEDLLNVIFSEFCIGK